MSSFGTIVRRALKQARHSIPSAARPGRTALAFGVAAGLVASALGPISPVRADPPPDPAARLQVVVQTVHIYNDRDGWGRGSGEMRLALAFCKAGATLDCKSERTLATSSTFNANTGETVTVGHILPDTGDPVSGGVTPETGFPVYPGEHWVFQAGMREDDNFNTEDMGEFRAQVDAEHGWGLGTFTKRSVRSDGSAGDFDVTFEVRRVPMPLLRINVVRETGTGAEQAYCVVVDNIGPQPAFVSPLTIKADGVLVREADLGAIGSNEVREHCVLRSELPAKEHTLRFAIDESRQVPELDEVHYPNERIVPSLLVIAGPEAGPVPASPEPIRRDAQHQPSGATPDLTVKAIRLNGRAPDGKDDCRVGTNGVTVVVKNAGAGEAGSFRVRLSVDGEDFDATADGLKAGQERDVTFESVLLKKGQHTFKALADPEHEISESRGNNNEMKINARCADAS